MENTTAISSFLTDTVLESTIRQTSESSSLTAVESSFKHDVERHVSVSSNVETKGTTVAQKIAVNNLTQTLQQTTIDSTLLYSSYNGGDVSESSLLLMPYAAHKLPGITDFALSLDASQISTASWNDLGQAVESHTTSSSFISNHRNTSSVLNTLTIVVDIFAVSTSEMEQFPSGYISNSDNFSTNSASSLGRNLEQNSSVTTQLNTRSSINDHLNGLQQKSVNYITSDSMLFLPTVSSSDTSLDNVSFRESAHISQAAAITPSDMPNTTSVIGAAKTSGDLYSTHKPEETTLTSSFNYIGNVPIKSATTPTLPPLTESPNGLSTNGESTILGGGLSDNYIYIGLPLCGLAVVILLILCIICIKRCKTKSKGSPAKNHIPDLWVNSCGEYLTIKKSVQEANGEDPVTVLRDLGCTTYEAVFEFKGEQYNHLSLKVGDRVVVRKKEPNGWWQGTVHDQTGWFQNSCVQAVSQDKVVTENEIAMHDNSQLASFVSTPTNRQSSLTEDEIKAEPIYCKIQPKEKRKSQTKDSDRSSSSSPTKSEASVEGVQQLYPIPPDGLTKFVALYPYMANCTGQLSISKGDIIMCMDHDVKDWTHGLNEATLMEGWVPSAYIEKVPMEKSPSPEIDLKCYNQLEVNTGMDNSQDFLGIIHKAIHTFNGEKAGDLPFQAGDLITVFQVLENGWWLGCKNKMVGWFPGSYVELINQPSTNSTPSPVSVSSITRSPTASPVPTEDIQIHSPVPAKDIQIHSPVPAEDIQIHSPVPAENIQIKSAVPAEDQQSLNIPSENSVQSVQNPLPKSKLKPSRKAPNPPLKTAGSVESKIPIPPNRISKVRVARPKVPPPPPPPPDATVKRSDDNTPHKSVQPDGPDQLTELAEIVKNQVTSNSGKDNLIEQTDNIDSSILPKKDKTKPPVPKRCIKPKLVSIPRHEIKMPETELGNSDLTRYRSPPPPRPMIPKLGPIRAKLRAPQSFEDQSPIEDETVFQVTPQRKFDALVRQESGPESPISLYKDFSSFGSTFGKYQDQKVIDVQDSVVDNDIPAKDAGCNSMNLCGKPTSIRNENFVKIENKVCNEENIKSEKIKNITNTPNEISVDSNEAVSNISTKVKSSKLPPLNIMKAKLSVESIKSVSQIPSESTLLAVDSLSEKPGQLTQSATDSCFENSLSGDNTTGENVLQCSSKLAATTEEEFPDKSNYVNVKETVGELAKHVENDRVEVDDLQARVDSIGKPHVAPKPKSGLPKLQLKPKTSVQTKKADVDSPVVDIIVSDHIFQPDVHSATFASSLVPDNNEPTDDSDAKLDNEKLAISATSLGSASTHLPCLRGRKSQIPGSQMRNKSTDKLDISSTSCKLSESDNDVSMLPNQDLKERTESSKSAKKQTSKPVKKTLRHRSNSPANRTGIPMPLRNRSSSPASVLAGSVPAVQAESPVSPRINSLAQKTSTSNKRSGLIPPKKISNGQEVLSASAVAQSLQPAFCSNEDLLGQNVDNIAIENLSPKLVQLSKLPRVQQQNVNEGKPPKHGKSLLSVIHNNKDTGVGCLDLVDLSNTGTKLKRAIPKIKQARLQQTEIVPSSDDNSNEAKRTLFQAIKGYSAQCDGELSFSEGTYVKELSDCDQPGWRVGMLADGTTGLYLADHFQLSPIDGHSEA